MSTPVDGTDQLLTPAEVAAMFRVDPKTVTRWAKAGKLTSVRTLGGHRRYLHSEVKALLARTTSNLRESTQRESTPGEQTVPAQQSPHQAPATGPHTGPPPGSGLAPLPPPPPTPGATGGLPSSG